MAKVTGLGGTFFKSQDPAALVRWYEEHLGVVSDGECINFVWRDRVSHQIGHTVWAAFPEDTTHFTPSTKDFMLNYRVDDLDALIAELTTAGVTVTGDVREAAYGRFAQVMDPEGNTIELWEPDDTAYAAYVHSTPAPEPRARLASGGADTTGRAIWFEVRVSDLNRAKAFYTEMFGWRYESLVEFDEEGYWQIITRHGEVQGALVRSPREAGAGGNGTIVYIHVDDLHAAMGKARSLGGHVFQRYTRISDSAGAFAIIGDPEANRLGLWAER